MGSNPIYWSRRTSLDGFKPTAMPSEKKSYAAGNPTLYGVPTACAACRAIRLFRRTGDTTEMRTVIVRDICAIDRLTW